MSSIVIFVSNHKKQLNATTRSVNKQLGIGIGIEQMVFAEGVKIRGVSPEALGAPAGTIDHIAPDSL